LQLCEHIVDHYVIVSSSMPKAHSIRPRAEREDKTALFE
jgi:hypothetical protein